MALAVSRSIWITRRLCFRVWISVPLYDHRSFDGLVLPTRRLVYPRRRDNRPRARPRLVWIEVADGMVLP